VGTGNFGTLIGLAQAIPYKAVFLKQMAQ
jgi:hypothetical protein